MTHPKGLIFSVVIVFVFLFPLESCGQNSNLDFKTRFEEKPDHILITAHRARTDDNKYPENSLESIQYCIQNRIDIVELDIRETIDGELVIMHDDSVNRTTDGEGKVSEMTAQKIKSLHLLNGGKVTASKVPTLEEVFQLIKGEIMIDIDFKASDKALKKTYDLIERYQIEDQILFFLYDYKKSEKAYSMNPKVMVMPRAYSVDDVKEILKFPFIKIIHIDPSFYEDDFTKDLLRRNISVWMNALGKYDKLEQESKIGMRSFLRKYPNVNVIQTDFPLSLRRNLEAL